MGGVGGGYLCIDDFHDRKYPEAVAKEIRRYVFRMGSFSSKLRDFSQHRTSVRSVSRPAYDKNLRNDSSSG